MKHNHIFKFIVILILLVSGYGAEAQDHKSVSDTDYNYKNKRSINISQSICLGREIGFNGSLEYENPDWGKLILRPQLSSMRSQNDVFNGVLMDFGIGYGYPLLKKEKHNLFANIYMTYFVCGTVGLVDGPSVVIEFEYRYKMKYNYLIIAPYYRSAYINNVALVSEDKSDFSYGFRIGIAHNLELKH